MHPAIRSPQRICYPSCRHWRAGPYLYGSNAVSCSSVGGGVNTKRDSPTDFHLQQKIEYKSGFIGNDYKKVVYLGKEVYGTRACSLI